MIGRPFDHWRTCIRHVREVAQPSQDANVEIVVYLNLTGEPHSRSPILHPGQSSFFGLGQRTGITGQYVYAAGRASRIAATTMQNIDTSVFDRQHEPSTGLGLYWIGEPFHSYDRHSFPF